MENILLTSGLISASITGLSQIHSDIFTSNVMVFQRALSSVSILQWVSSFPGPWRVLKANKTRQDSPPTAGLKFISPFTNHLWPCLVLLIIKTTPRGKAMVENIYMSPLKTKSERKLIIYYTEKLSQRGINRKLQLRPSVSMTISHELEWISKSGTEKRHFQRVLLYG